MPVEERHNATYNPLCEVFPRIASCEYVRYGVGGVQETRSALCILGLNMINDKVIQIADIAIKRRAWHDQGPKFLCAM